MATITPKKTRASRAKSNGVKKSTVAAKPIRKRTPVKKVVHPHFAIGLPVRIRQGSLPIGWDKGSMGRFIPDHFDKADYTHTSQIQSVADDGLSFEVKGWYWKPEDLEIPWGS